ncbi:TusE/DsrC/DsvC family sulfur relay protein [Vibrio chagasii]|nr:TusE/DsrC/DsvC family sulfur relay protein [Vibrio chagasii]
MTIELTEAHLEVVHFVRLLRRVQHFPAVRMLVKRWKKPMAQKKVTVNTCSKLFKKAQRNKRAKLAGLPKPAKWLCNNKGLLILNQKYWPVSYGIWNSQHARYAFTFSQPFA